MKEPNNEHSGEESDNWLQAGNQLTNAVKQAGKASAVETGKNAAMQTARASAAAVQTGVESGKAVAQIAAGTAAGGPFGAIVSAAWSMRHTLFKILIIICLIVLIIIIVVISLPQIIFEHIFGKENTSQETIKAVYYDLEKTVTEVIENGYELALDEVERIITDGGYDYTASKAAIINIPGEKRVYDVCYILAAYSITDDIKKINKLDLQAKLKTITDKMFPVTYEEIMDGEIFYVRCTISSFNVSIVLEAFNIDAEGHYAPLGLTNLQAIEYMSNFLKMTLFGTAEIESG